MTVTYYCSVSFVVLHIVSVMIFTKRLSVFMTSVTLVLTCLAAVRWSFLFEPQAHSDLSGCADCHVAACTVPVVLAREPGNPTPETLKPKP